MVAGGHVSGATVVSVIVTFTALAGVMVILRLCTRKMIVQNPGFDDYLVALGLILSVFLTVTMCEQVVYGMGRHESTLTEHDGVMSLRWFWASVWTYYLALWAVKVSILFQYLRILSGGYRHACYVLMSIVTVWTLWAFFSAVFACTPINAFWDLSVKGACLDRLAVWFSNAAVNIITDLATAILPLPTLYNLRMARRQKIILMCVFGMGGITCLLSILRLQSLYVISKSTDISWDNPSAATWSSLEVNVGIICSCIPPLKGLVSRLFPKLSFGDSYDTAPSTHQRSTMQNAENRSSFGKLGFHLPDAEKGAVVETHELSPTIDRHLTSIAPGSTVARTRGPSPLKEREDAKDRVSKNVGFKHSEVTRQDCVRDPSPGFTIKNQEAEKKVRTYIERRPTDATSVKPDDTPFTSDSVSTIHLKLLKLESETQEGDVSPM